MGIISTQSFIQDNLYLLDNVLEGKFVVEGEQIIEVDFPFTKIMGYDDSELLDQPLVFLFADEYKNDVQEILSSKDSQNYPSFFKRSNGKKFPVEIESKTIESSNERLTKLISIVDISRKKEAEDKLLESEIRFRTVTEHSSDITFIMDMEGKCVYISSSITQSIGFSPFELNGIVANHIFHPEDLGKVVECKMKAIQNPGKIIKLQSCRVKHKHNNNWVYFEGLFNYLPDAPGVEGVVVNCRVITERLKHEKQLRESWERLGMTIDAVSDGYWDWNVKTGHVFFSDKWIKNLGYVREEVGKHESFWDKVIHPDDLKKDEQELERHFRGGKEFYECEYRILNKDGRYSWNLNRGKVVAWDNKNNPLRMVGTSVDVTEKKEAELVTKRLEQQLQQAQKLETIGNMAGGIAHDFKNLLNPIIGFSKLALEDINDQQKLICDLEIIRKASERADDLVNQIFTFSKRKELVKEPINLTTLIHEVVDLLDINLAKGVRIEKSIKSDGMILADSVQMHQVLMNLCKNALQAMEDKGNCLTIKLYRKKSKVIVEINDNGPGISSEIQDKIFDPFFTTKNSSKGTGLGLSVVHGIITNHQGTIEVNSKLSKGTTFTISIPEYISSAGTDGVLQRPIAVLVDDEEMSVLLLKRILSQNGFEVVTFDNGLDALKYVTNNKQLVKLVICDETLPGISGTELCKIIKTLKHIKLHTVLTTHHPHQHLVNMKEKGVNSLYIKPLNIQDVSKKVQQISEEINASTTE